MNADGSGQRRLAGGWPSGWSPDGKKIVFTADSDRSRDLHHERGRKWTAAAHAPKG